MLRRIRRPYSGVRFANSELDNRYRELTNKDSRYRQLWSSIFKTESILDKLPDQIESWLASAMDSFRAMGYWYKEHEKEFGSSSHFQYDKKERERMAQNMSDMHELIYQLIKLREKNRMGR